MRDARDIMADIAAAGLAPEQLALVMELTASLSATNTGTRSKGALRQERYRNRQREASQSVTSDADVTVVTLCDGCDADVAEVPSPSPLPDKAPQTPKINPTPRPHPGTAREPARMGTRLPVDFSIPEDWLAWAIAERGWSRREAESEADSFHDHWIAKPGKDGRKVDWAATWRNWVRKSRRANGHGQRDGHGGFSARSDRRDGLARALDRRLGLDGPTGAAGRQDAFADPGSGGGAAPLLAPLR